MSCAKRKEGKKANSQCKNRLVFAIPSHVFFFAFVSLSRLAFVRVSARHFQFPRVRTPPVLYCADRVPSALANTHRHTHTHTKARGFSFAETRSALRSGENRFNGANAARVGECASGIRHFQVLEGHVVLYTSLQGILVMGGAQHCIRSLMEFC